jgi:glycosyltransferase involved in cell wall biosynthesis
MPVQAIRPTLTVAVLTLNEAKRITACLKSVSFADQLLVIDSGSKDETVHLAQQAGAEVLTYSNWQGFAAQRNHQLAHSRCDYIFFLDADEQVTPELAQEIQHAVASQTDCIWRITWEQVAFGRRLSKMRNSSSLPRFFRREWIVRFEGVVHEHAVLARSDIQQQHFKARLPHFSRETIHDSLLKLAQYSHLGASKRAAQGKRGGVFRGLCSAAANFIRFYFFHRGFMCGPEGFLHCLFVSLECFFRYTALRYDSDRLSEAVKR